MKQIRLLRLLLAAASWSALFAPSTLGSHTPNPGSVTVAGSFQAQLACSGDWQPDCTVTHLVFDSADDVWQGTYTVPAGNWEYKAPLNDSWAENYGAKATRDGANIPLNLAQPTQVKFYYDHKTHWITDNVNSRIVTAPGSYQAAIGCPGDWQPDCLRSWLEDPDGDGIYEFTTTAIPTGNYEFKIAINESWNESYGEGGGGNNIAFSVPGPGSKVTFRFDSAHSLPGVIVQSTVSTHNNNVEWEGLRHDSRDTLYRSPGGAVPAGSSVLIRFRTFHNDVTDVALRVYEVNGGTEKIVPMTLAATDCGCAEPGLEEHTCDLWETTLQEKSPNNLWYRFIVTDGTDMDYYADDTGALDGGLGSPSDNPIDNSYALMFYDPNFRAPSWAKSASIYQIFPDRFNDGRANNNPRTGDIRYEDPVLKLPWGTLPEGYCRNYADGGCAWRFDTSPPDWSPTKEQPRGRDYFGGDLKGIDQKLDYLQDLGIDTLYLNPIFDAASNHGYDTQDYYKIDPYFGTQKDWENLVKHANQRGMRIILDGVFNHLSSDSPFFDRYGHYGSAGACEAVSAPYRDWFYFYDVEPGTGFCVSALGANSATYGAWFGADSLPVLNKSLPAVQSYFLTDRDSVSKHWLREGASGWRLDVMGDPSFPSAYWPTFRREVKSTKPDAFIIGETWQKDSTLLRMLRGETADTTMNYRLRDAVLGLLAPQPFDGKGFPDSGRVIAPSQFASRLASIREDYPDAAYYSLMNLLDSHDTERLRWTLTPGDETTASKELNAANVAEGKRRQRIASLIQFTVPGAPTVYYGDEVGMTGDDDPDNRRTFPWQNDDDSWDDAKSGSKPFSSKNDGDRRAGGSPTAPDNSLVAHYKALNALRNSASVLAEGDFKILLADDAAQLVAYGRKSGNQAALVLVNRAPSAQNAVVPVAGYLPDGISLWKRYSVGDSAAQSASVKDGSVPVSIGGLSAVLLVSGKADLQPPSTPAELRVTGEGNGQVSLAWKKSYRAGTYNVYRSPVRAGGYAKINSAPLSATTFTDTGLRNGTYYFYVVTALDSTGNESAFSNEAAGLPHLIIGWANLQWPPTLVHTISAVNRTADIYGQVWIDGATSQPGPTPGLLAQLGFGPQGTNPRASSWIWVDAGFNTDAGNNDEFKASLLPETTGSFDYVYRYSTTGGRDWLYADLNGPVPDGNLPGNTGKLTVNSTGDTTPPAKPTGLRVVSASPNEIDLQWDAVIGDASLYGYEVLRSSTPGGPYALVARITSNSYTDQAVMPGASYSYVVRSLDQSFNRSGNSAEVAGKADYRTVAVTFVVTVPASTDNTGRSVYIAGSLQLLEGGLPEWNPGGVTLARVDSTHWMVTLAGREGTQIEYKYTLGDWDHVEKGSSCGEVPNRQLTLNYGVSGLQTVNDSVANWAPCGN